MCSAPRAAWRTTGDRRASPGAAPDLFIAQNVGELYIGAIPLLLILLAGAAWSAVGARDTLLHDRRHCHAALCAWLVHARVPGVLHAGAGHQPVPPTRRRHVPGRRARCHPGRLCRASVVYRAEGRHIAPASLDRRRHDRRRHPPLRPAGGMARPLAALALSARHQRADVRGRRPAALLAAARAWPHSRRWPRSCSSPSPRSTSPTTMARTARPPCRPPPTTCCSRPPTTPPSPS